MPIVHREACAPNPSHQVELFSLSIFDFSITNLYLPIFLGVVWCGEEMVYSVLLQQYSEVCIIEVWATVADDGPRTTISGEDASHNKVEHLPMVVCPYEDDNMQS